MHRRSASRSRCSGTPCRPRRSAGCCSSPRASCSCAGRRGAATRGRCSSVADDRGDDRRLHARRPRRNPPRRRADLLRPRAGRAVPRLPADRRARRRAVRARAEHRSSPRSRTSARSRSGCSRCATAPAAPVLAVRSTSIVIATLLAGRVLAERVSRERLAGSVARLRRRRAARALACSAEPVDAGEALGEEPDEQRARAARRRSGSRPRSARRGRLRAPGSRTRPRGPATRRSRGSGRRRRRRAGGT